MASTPTKAQRLSKFATALTSFTSSPNTSPFRIIHSIPSAPIPSSSPKNLYILDSSFNPPTLAHQHIATSALLSPNQALPHNPNRLLLLLATQNADKAPKPASYEQRLAMLDIFASSLFSSFSSSSSPTTTSQLEGIDIALTTLPYFVDKSLAIERSESYPPETTQIHLTGFDTLIRILDPKYYPPAYNLELLAPFLEKHWLRVSYRTAGGWGEREDQDGYLRTIGEGKREGEGAKREWVREGRVVLVEGRKEGEEVVSSTRVRQAVKMGDREALGRLVTEEVREWILEEGLYLD